MTERDGELALGGTPAAAAETPRGPGRPKGARNKRGRDWQAWIDASGEHPIAFLARIYRAPPGSLLGREGPDGNPIVDSKEELALKIRAAEAVLPYVEQKLPALDEDEASGSKRILMIVGEMTADQAQQAERAFGFRLKQNQGVSDAEIVKSDGEQSDGEPNLLTFNGDRENDH